MSEKLKRIMMNHDAFFATLAPNESRHNRKKGSSLHNRHTVSGDCCGLSQKSDSCHGKNSPNSLKLSLLRTEAEPSDNKYYHLLTPE